jgi:prepilin-type processing-associated H-X9-DG protein
MYVADYDERSQGPVGAGVGYNFMGGGGCGGCFQRYESNWENVCAGAGRNYSPLTPYTKNSQLWKCPSALNDFRSYGWNRGGESQSIGTIAFPSESVMFADARDANIAWLPTNNTCCGSEAGLQGTYPHFVGTTHNDGANIAFWDGHVKWAKASSLPIAASGNGYYFDY